MNNRLVGYFMQDKNEDQKSDHTEYQAVDDHFPVVNYQVDYIIIESFKHAARQSLI